MKGPHDSQLSIQRVASATCSFSKTWHMNIRHITYPPPHGICDNKHWWIRAEDLELPFIVSSTGCVTHIVQDLGLMGRTHSQCRPIVVAKCCVDNVRNDIQDFLKDLFQDTST